MSFEIKDKVALISGGASGLGLRFAKELLKNGLKGVTLADVNGEYGAKALQEIENEFGSNRAVFVQTDVTDKQSYEEAFKKTIKVFENLDILINNAGIFNDAIWEKEIAINVNGVIHGVLLGLENYIPKYRAGSEGVIVNISSTIGIEGYAVVPVYTGTKFAIIGMSKAWGDQSHYNRTKVKVLTLCPGSTETSLLFDISGRNLGKPYQDILESTLDSFITQKPESVAQALVKIIQNAKSGTIWVAQGGQEPYEYKIKPMEDFAPK